MGADVDNSAGARGQGERTPWTAAKASRPILSLAVTMLISFSLSVAFMLWQRKREQAPRSQLQVASTVPVARAAPSLPEREDPIHSPQHAIAPDIAPPVLCASTAVAAPQVPVFFHWSNSALGSEGNVRNTTANPMDLTIRVVSAGTPRISQIELQLAAGEQKSFGPNDGLIMQSGDQIFMQSPPFRDRIVSAP